MEVKIKKTDFLNILKWPQGVVEKRGTMPILSNILLEASGDHMKVSATDLELALVTEGKAEVKSGGKAVVNARNLYEIVKEAPDESIKISKKGESLEILSGKSRFKVVGMNPEEFPTLSKISSSEEISMEGEDVEDMIRKTHYAASTDETRYTLNGVCLVKVQKGDKVFLRLVATDGHRLSYTERETNKNWNLLKGIIIPRKGVAELRNLISNSEGDLLVSMDDKAIRFRRGKTAHTTLTVRLIEGDFPNYEQVIPKKSDKIVSVDRSLLLGALRRASIMTSDQARGVKFSFSEGVLEISSSHPDLGEASEEVAIDYKGTKFQVGFNPRYYLDLLGVMEDEKVVLELKDEVSPCVVRSEFDRGFLALIMPMRI